MNSFSEDKAGARLAEILAARQGFSPAVARQIRTAAILHDIGKQKIPAVILHKPGKLDKLEFEVIKAHTTLGANMLANVQGDLGAMIQNVCLYHHEWHNGAGYWGKSAEELPAYIQIVSISDVFMALINQRPYKSAWPLEAALIYIQNQAGTQFSRELVNAFLSLAESDGQFFACLR